MNNQPSVEDVLTSIKTEKNSKFSKKKFEDVMLAMANDIDFAEDVAKVKNSELSEVQHVLVSKGFRSWCRKLLEKAGIDKAESGRIMTEEFEIDTMSGLYEFFVSAVYEYMSAGYKFDLLPKEDFKGSIYLGDVEEKETITDDYSPKDRSYLGQFKKTEKAHKKLKAESPCPSYLKTRICIK